jgi:hypothetical protein
MTLRGSKDQGIPGATIRENVLSPGTNRLKFYAARIHAASLSEIAYGLKEALLICRIAAQAKGGEKVVSYPAIEEGMLRSIHPPTLTIKMDGETVDRILSQKTFYREARKAASDLQKKVTEEPSSRMLLMRSPRSTSGLHGSLPD